MLMKYWDCTDLEELGAEQPWWSPGSPRNHLSLTLSSGDSEMYWEVRLEVCVTLVHYDAWLSPPALRWRQSGRTRSLWRPDWSTQPPPTSPPPSSCLGPCLTQPWLSPAFRKTLSCNTKWTKSLGGGRLPGSLDNSRTILHWGRWQERLGGHCGVQKCLLKYIRLSSCRKYKQKKNQ